MTTNPNTCASCGKPTDHARNGAMLPLCRACADAFAVAVMPDTAPPPRLPWQLAEIGTEGPGVE